MQLSNDLPSRLARLTFTAIMGLVLCGYVEFAHGPRAAAAEAAADAAAPRQGTWPATRPSTAPTAADLKRVADEMERGFATLEAAAKEIPRDTFDPKAIIDAVQGDPVKLFAWVRDQTYLVPYRGILRDYQGVLMDRTGNSLDRALLLLTLFRQAGHKRVQLAFADLSEADATRLLQGSRPIPAEGPRISTSPTAQELNDLFEMQGKKYRTDPAKIRDLYEQTTVRQQRQHEEAVQRTVQQSAELMEILRKNGAVPVREKQISRLRSDAVKALRQHWWLQWHNGKEWVDLDPSLPDASPGGRAAIATRTVAPEKVNEELKDEVHQVVIRVVIERWNSGQLEEGVVLAQPLWPCALIGGRVSIHHVPMNWPKDAELVSAKDPGERLRSIAMSERAWMPVLSVEAQHAAKNAFTDEGRIAAAKNLPGFVKSVAAGLQVAGGVEKGAQAAGAGAFKGLRGGGIGGIGQREQDQPELNIMRDPALKSVLTAEWIEYEIHAPGRASQSVRRQLFDLLGPAARQAAKEQNPVPAPTLTDNNRLSRGLALLGQTEIHLQVGRLSPEFVADLAVQKSLANREVMPKILRSVAVNDFTFLKDQTAQITRISQHLFTWALMRQKWCLRPGELYFDRVHIAQFHTYLEPGDERKVRRWAAFDIVANEMAVHPRANGDPFVVRVEQGVLDTNVEALVLAAPGGSDNTAEAFQRREVDRNAWGLFAPGDEMIANEKGAPIDVRARMHQDVIGGSIVIAPARPMPQSHGSFWGWWRIHGETGTTLGMGPRGWGQATVEFTVQHSFVVVAMVIALTEAYWCLNDRASPPITRPSEIACVAGFVCVLPLILLLLAWPLGAVAAVGFLSAGPAAVGAIGTYFAVCDTLFFLGDAFARGGL